MVVISSRPSTPAAEHPSDTRGGGQSSRSSWERSRSGEDAGPPRVARRAAAAAPAARRSAAALALWALAALLSGGLVLELRADGERFRAYEEVIQGWVSLQREAEALQARMLQEASAAAARAAAGDGGPAGAAAAPESDADAEGEEGCPPPAPAALPQACPAAPSCASAAGNASAAAAAAAVHMAPLPTDFDFRARHHRRRTPPPRAAATAPPRGQVYVYDDLPAEYNSALLADQPRCATDQYGTEVALHQALLASPVRTTDPARADFFFVPVYGECFWYRAAAEGGPAAAAEATNAWYRGALAHVAQRHPHWNRTAGRDHVWVFAGARGPSIFRDWKGAIRRSVFLTPEGDRSLSMQFNTWKDVVIPGLEAQRELWGGELRERAVPRRDILLHFRGTVRRTGAGGEAYSRGLRARLEEVLTGQEGVVFGTHGSGCDRDCYLSEMRRAVFCLCPRGWSPWTLRTYQAMMAGCIPVVLADEIEFPFENFLDWSRLVIKVPERDADDVLALLLRVPPAEVAARQAAIAAHWRMFTYPQPSRPGDAVHAILRELGLKRRRFKASALTFWT